MNRIIRSRYILPSVGFLVAILFGTLLYPVVEPDFHRSLSTDGHDRLGLGLYHYDTLSFYPAKEPTVMRGPIYPVVVATAITVGGEGQLRWSILILQALMHAVSVTLGARIVTELAGRHGMPRDRLATLAGLIIAIHPFPLWYVTRVVVEPLSIMLCTAIALLLLVFSRTGLLFHGILLGIAVGLAALTKSTYVLFIPLIPLLLWLHRRDEHFSSPGRITFATLLLPLLIISPWTLRNWVMTDAIVPVHILDGVNLAVGDHFVEHFGSSPLGYAPIVERFRYPGLPQGLAGMMEMNATESVVYDRRLRQRSLERYAEDPLFLVRKIAVQTVTFWTVGSRPVVTLLIGGMQLALLLVVLLVAGRLIRRHGVFAAPLIPLWLLLAYWLAHTPLYAIGRFSVVWVPVMVAYGVTVFEDRMPDATGR